MTCTDGQITIADIERNIGFTKEKNILEEKKLVIFHRDTVYSGRLMGVCNRTKTGGFSAVTFAERTLLEDYLRNNPSSVLLCEENTADIAALQTLCRKMFILCESVPAENMIGAIFRYRAASEVLKAVGEERSFSAEENVISGKIVGVTSDSDDGEGSEYAWKLAKKWAENGKVLFVALSVLYRPDGTNAGENAVSELFYRLNREEKLETADLVTTVANVDCICGYAFWADADELTVLGMEKLSEFLSLCDYDKVVLDLCSLKSFTVPLLLACDRIIIKKTDGLPGEERFSEMKRQLAFAGHGDLLVRMEEA